MNEPLYKKRREALLAQMQEGVGVVASARYRIRSNDTEYPYRQNSDFYYLSGFKEDNAALVFVKIADMSKVLLFVQSKNEKMELWSGKRLGVDAAVESFDVDEVHCIENFEEVLKEELKNKRHLYLDLFNDDALYTKAKELCAGLLHDRGTKMSPRVYIDICVLIRKMRLVKDEHEIAMIKKAICITKEAHHNAMRRAKPGLMEYMLQAEIEHTFKSRGAYSDAYTTIVAGSDNANTLHYISNNELLTESELVLIDAGSEYGMYASDITRTFPVSGRFTPSQRRLYEMVLDVELRIIGMIKPGITKTALQEASERWLAEGLIGLGVLKDDAEKIMEEKTHKKYFPHGIGHWMGLDVHDPCPYVDDEGNDLPFAPGMVLTIEPGIYIRRDDTDAPEEFRGTGIRIEDNVLVTKEGCENLSEGIAKTVEEIEQVCNDTLS